MKRFSTLSFLTILMISPLWAESGNETQKETSAENSVSVNAYGGYGFYFWKPLGGMRADASYDKAPFRMIRVGAEADYSFFTFGLEYSNNKVYSTGISVFKNENDSWDKDHLAEQLKIFNGLTFGKYTITVSAIYQKYKTKVQSKQSIPLNYYSKNDGLITLHNNDSINWYSKYAQYDFKCERVFSKYITAAAGLRYMTFEAPTEVTVNGYGPSHRQATILLYTKNKLYDPHLDINLKYPVSSNFYPQLSIATSVFILSSYYPENSYFETQHTKPLSADSFQFVGIFSMNFSLHYIREKLQIEGGIGFDYVDANISYSDCKVKRDAEGYDALSGDYAQFHAGENVSLDFFRSDFFWGVYIKASYSF